MSCVSVHQYANTVEQQLYTYVLFVHMHMYYVHTIYMCVWNDLSMKLKWSITNCMELFKTSLSHPRCTSSRCAGGKCSHLEILHFQCVYLSDWKLGMQIIALCPQVKLRLQLLVVQPLLDVHDWTSGPVRSSTLYTTLVWGLTDTHNLSHQHNLRWAGQGWWNSWLLLHSWSCCQTHPPNQPRSSFTLTSHSPHTPHNPSLTPHPPHLSQWHSVQFKLIVTSMSSTEDHGRSQRKDTLDPIPTSLKWK